MEKTNGNIPATPQTLNLGPNDKFVIILVDDANKAINVMAPNIPDEIEVGMLVAAAQSAVLAQYSQRMKAEKSRIVKPVMLFKG